MEEQMDINQNNNQIANRRVKLRASEIIKRFKSILRSASFLQRKR